MRFEKALEVPLQIEAASVQFLNGFSWDRVKEFEVAH